MYNWRATQAAYPPDWHLPSDDEWKALTAFLGFENVAGAKLKESGYCHWFSPNIGSTNEIGFTALSAGCSEDGGFNSEGYLGYWWSSTEYNTYDAWYRSMDYSNSTAFRYNSKKEYGFSVRCVRDSETSYLKEPPVSDFTASKTSINEGETIRFTNESDNSPTSCLWSFGDNTTSTEKSPKHTYSAVGTYTVSLQATNSFGTNTKRVSNYITVTGPGNGGTRSFVYQDRTYETIIINGKEWMAENLAYLPAVYPSRYGSDGSNTEPRYYVYDYEGTDVTVAKNKENYATYGVLYNWPAALAACPPGWHLPSDVEWTALTKFLGGESVAGEKLKESGYSHWFSIQTFATNEIGFTALPAGVRYITGNEGIGHSGFWWSTTEFSTYSAWHRFVTDSGSKLYRNPEPKESGLSVRCVKD